jgi:uncharacterized repeat protein (TIGR03803 family)
MTNRTGYALRNLALVVLALASLTLRAAGREKIIRTFNGRDGENPFAAVILDPSGNLYGTTSYGGADNVGTVFELSPTGDGTWKEKIIHNFQEQWS